MAAQDFFDGRLADIVSKFEQFTFDLAITHAWILACQAHNQRFDIWISPRSTWLT